MQLSYIIMMEILLLILSKAKGEMSYEENKLFVQYKYAPEASGWYKMLDINLYVRDIEFSSAIYVFRRSYNVWMLSVFPRNESIYRESVIYSTDQSIASLLQENFTNYKGTLEHKVSQFESPSDEKSTFRSLNKRKSKEKNRKREMLLNDRFEDVSKDSSLEQGLNEPVKGINDAQETEEILKIFNKKKCSCTKLEIQYNGMPYKEYYRSDINRNLSAYCNLSNVQEFSNENRNSSLSNNNNNSFHDKHSEEWEEEVYFSYSCQKIYFDNADDKWVAELKNYCSASEKGIYSIIWLDESAPCIEYLPPPRRQKWKYFSRLTVFEDSNVLDTTYIEECGGHFKPSIYENFTITCASMRDDLSWYK
ncbi:hypothetical protein Avbf_12157 [Armadillidium vulgare]|nr:hypothetical protein Avbf_12157 [Armadillidium vulgare]